MLVVKSGSHKRKILSENYPQFWHALARRFASPALNCESLKNIGLRKRQIFSRPGADMSRAGPGSSRTTNSYSSSSLFGRKTWATNTRTYLLTYLLHGAESFLRTGLQLVKKFHAFYGTQGFITAFTSPRHLHLS